MKRFMILVLAAAMMLVTLALAASEEEAFMLEGLIADIGEGYAIVQTAEHGEVQVNFDDDTELDGIDEVAAGQYVFVEFDGQMTFSLPPQVYALKISAFIAKGIIVEIADGSIVIEQGEEQIVIHLPEDAPTLYEGGMVAAYSNGIMALSLPPQMTALHIQPEMVSGTVTEIGDGYMLIEAGDEGEYRIIVASDERVEVGGAVDVYYNGVQTLSIPPQISAVAIEITVERD